MGGRHDNCIPPICPCAPCPLATALHPLHRVPSAGAWLWLVRATTCEPAAALSVVLLLRLSVLLLAAGPEFFRHG
jgi:hypothetical protein